MDIKMSINENTNILSKQRKVSEKLGKNITSKHEKIYSYIESKIGPMKDCMFGHIRGSKTGIKHEGEKSVLIKDFELKGCNINELGEVIINNGDGLQGFCRDCSKKRRKKRLEMSREKNKNGYDTYENEYGKKTKQCSLCNEEKEIRDNFKLSPGMECGIHNICIECSKKYGESMGDRLIKYRPDGNFKYKKTEENQHDDHIFPLAYGGTNEELNHQIISAKENLSKSSTIPFETVIDIPESLMCERWRPILREAKTEMISMIQFKSRISSAILEEQKKIYSMTDEKIEEIFKQYNKDNNRRVNTTRTLENLKNIVMIY